jgi:hypothetical protein
MPGSGPSCLDGGWGGTRRAGRRAVRRAPPRRRATIPGRGGPWPGAAHRLVRHAPDTISPLCWRSRRRGLTVNLRAGRPGLGVGRRRSPPALVGAALECCGARSRRPARLPRAFSARTLCSSGRAPPGSGTPAGSSRRRRATTPSGAAGAARRRSSSGGWRRAPAALRAAPPRPAPPCPRDEGRGDGTKAVGAGLYTTYPRDQRPGWHSTRVTGAYG